MIKSDRREGYLQLSPIVIPIIGARVFWAERMAKMSPEEFANYPIVKFYYQGRYELFLFYACSSAKAVLIISSYFIIYYFCEGFFLEQTSCLKIDFSLFISQVIVVKMYLLII